MHPDGWATAVNLECKLLLLQYCFEELLTVRVQLKTDEQNLRSRKAIEKIGGQFEGIMRNDMIRDNHTRRNAAYYSLIEEEWTEQKSKLSNLYLMKRTACRLTVQTSFPDYRHRLFMSMSCTGTLRRSEYNFTLNLKLQ